MTTFFRVGMAGEDERRKAKNADYERAMAQLQGVRTGVWQ